MKKETGLNPFIQWMLLGLALIAVIFCFTQKMDPSVNRIIGVYMNFGHVVAFFLWTYLCFVLIRPLKQASCKVQFFFTVLFSLITGTVIELIQQNIGREACISDVFSDITGALFAYLLLSNKRHDIQVNVRIMAIAVLLIITGFMHRYLVMVPINEYYQRKQFPVVFNPETPFESTRLSFDAKRKIIYHERYGALLQIDFDTEPYSSIAVNSFPVNWQGFSTLEVELMRPGEAAWPLTLRIDDLDHARSEEQRYDDRFNRVYTLTQQTHTLKIPLDEIMKAPKAREMNINEIGSIGLFTRALKKPRRLWLRKIRLLK